MDAQELRGLLELAAKAAGYDVVWNEQWQCFQHRNPRPDSIGVVRHPWVPNDDGDSRRMEVALRLSVIHSIDGAVMVMSHDLSVAVTEAAGGDQDATTRLAVLRAAAEIGRSMA